MNVSPLNLPGLMAVEEATVRFAATDIPASGYAVYRLVPTDSPFHAMPPTAAHPATVLENDRLSVVVSESGRVSLHDLESGWKTDDLFSFEDSADLGDSYCFIPDPTGKPFELSGIKPSVEWVEKTALRQCIRLEYRFELPAEFDRNTHQRSAERVENRVSLELALQAGSPALDLSGRIENASKDHRFRIWVHTGIDTNRNTSSQPLDCVERKRFPEQPDLKQDWTHPNNGWVSVSDGNNQVSVLTDGMYDYEHLPDARHSLAFTCVRSTGRILAAEFDPTTREVPPSPEWACPDNQCLRTNPFHLAIRPGRISPAGLIREQQCWIAPMLTGFDSVAPHRFLEGRPALQDSELSEMFYRDLPSSETNLPLRSQGIALDGDVAFSAHKRTENRDGYVLRIYNPSSDAVSVALSGTASVQETTMAEVPSGESRPVEGKHEWKIPPKRIATIGVA
jgi:alpha-mannosidase